MSNPFPLKEIPKSNHGGVVLPCGPKKQPYHNTIACHFPYRNLTLFPSQKLFSKNGADTHNTE